MEDTEKTKWIWLPAWEDKDKETARVVLFRKGFLLDAAPMKAELKISADTRYKLYVNESFVQIGPSRGDLQIWFFDTIDISPYLRKGKNMIAVKVLRYPEDPMQGNHGMFRTPTPGLFVEGTVEDVNGNPYTISADESWRCIRDDSVSFIREEERFAPLYIHEKAFGHERTLGWKRISYNDENWEAARPYRCEEIPQTTSPGKLYPRTIPFMSRKRRHFVDIKDIKKSGYSSGEWKRFLQGNQIIEIPADSEEIIEIDAGEEMTGFLSAEFMKGADSRIKFLYAEAYVQDGCAGREQIPIKTDRIDKEHGHLQGYEDLYTVGGMGEEDAPEVYEPYWFRTFRFIRIQITTADCPLIIRKLDYEEVGYPLKVLTRVETSDKTLRQIWEISERTLRRCMHESYEDCPYYEQLQYIMDARQQILYTYAVSADDRLARKCMDDLRRSQRADGLLNASYPNCTANIIPGFSIYYILMVYDHMMYFGDRSLVSEHMPVMMKILDFYDAHLTKEGYVEKIGDINHLGSLWSFIDWAEEWDETDGMPTAGKSGPVTMESLLYIYGLTAAARMNEFLGRDKESESLTVRAEKVREAVRKCCTGTDGMIQDGPGLDEYSQHCQVFAVLTGVVDLTAGRKNLLKTIKEKGYAQCTVAMSFYLFRALEKTDLYEYTDHYWDVWRRMIANHCTTCVEAEGYARSECHAWGALILYELPTITLGVRPVAPGYRKIRIAPVIGYLTYASGVVKTPVGDVEVSWKVENGKLQLDYQVPQGIEIMQLK